MKNFFITTFIIFVFAGVLSACGSQTGCDDDSQKTGGSINWFWQKKRQDCSATNGGSTTSTTSSKTTSTASSSPTPSPSPSASPTPTPLNDPKPVLDGLQFMLNVDDSGTYQICYLLTDALGGPYQRENLVFNNGQVTIERYPYDACYDSNAALFNETVNYTIGAEIAQGVFEFDLEAGPNTVTARPETAAQATQWNSESYGGITNWVSGTAQAFTDNAPKRMSVIQMQGTKLYGSDLYLLDRTDVETERATTIDETVYGTTF